MPLNEDIEYTISEVAIADKPQARNTANEELIELVESVVDDIDTTIDFYRSTDSLDLSDNAPLTLEQQVYLAKRDNLVLKTLRDKIATKLKDYKHV